MEKLEINKSIWYIKLMCSLYDERFITDTCQLRRRLIWMIIFSPLILITYPIRKFTRYTYLIEATIVLVGLTMLLALIGILVFISITNPMEVVIPLVGSAFIVSIVAGILYFTAKVQKFLTSKLYRSWKDKYCKPIKFK